jgi:hypothetical protein
MNTMKTRGILLAILVAGSGLAQQSSDKAMLTFPILFAKQFNYQGLHIYDTF